MSGTATRRRPTFDELDATRRRALHAEREFEAHAPPDWREADWSKRTPERDELIRLFTNRERARADYREMCSVRGLSVRDAVLLLGSRFALWVVQRAVLGLGR